MGLEISASIMDPRNPDMVAHVQQQFQRLLSQKKKQFQRLTVTHPQVVRVRATMLASMIGPDAQ